MCKIKISDCIISGKNVPIEVVDKILEYHIRPMEEVQKIHDGDITCSDRSGYRPPVYEIKKGRSGKGQHTFIGKGAIDWKTTGSLSELFDEMLMKTQYTRICIYIESNFIHADYKKTDGNVHLYKNTLITKDDGKKEWQWIKFEKQPLKRPLRFDAHGI